MVRTRSGKATSRNRAQFCWADDVSDSESDSEHTETESESNLEQMTSTEMLQRQQQMQLLKKLTKNGANKKK